MKIIIKKSALIPLSDRQRGTIIYLSDLEDEIELEVEEKDNHRTVSQNNALHRGLSLLADTLNNAGLEMRRVIKEDVDIEWTTQSAKDYLFRPIMKSLYKIDSTRNLKKGEGQIEKVWDTLMRHLGEKFGVEYIGFPHDPHKQEKQAKEERELRQSIDYPESVEPKF